MLQREHMIGFDDEGDDEWIDVLNEHPTDPDWSEVRA